MTPAPNHLFALVDCSNFYVSCERVFNPALRDRPVAVLSNNDGCVVSRSEEVKAMGVPMGVPFFQVRHQMQAAGVVVFSSNYELYSNMSRRVFEVLESFTSYVQKYSIDEAFLRLVRPPEGWNPDELTEVARRIVRRVDRDTGIPVRVAIAETKTLTKIGSSWARHLTEAGLDPAICLYGKSSAERKKILVSTPVKEVWGIGRSHSKWLIKKGIDTVEALKNADDEFIRKQMGITGLRTVHELRGNPCIPFVPVKPMRKSVIRSRSFSNPVTCLDKMRQAVATYAAWVATKLRSEDLVAGTFQVYITTGHPSNQGPRRSVSRTITLTERINSTPEIIAHCHRLLNELWESHDEHGEVYRYRKAGVVAVDIRSADGQQGCLFSERNPDTGALMHTLDKVNKRFGRRSLIYAAEGTPHPSRLKTETGTDWSMRQQLLSGRYTTRWDELHVVYAR